jgi:hypothetical protein
MAETLSKAILLVYRRKWRLLEFVDFQREGKWGTGARGDPLKECQLQMRSRVRTSIHNLISDVRFLP